MLKKRRKRKKKEENGFFHSFHQNDLFAQYRIERPSAITGGLKSANKFDHKSRTEAEGRIYHISRDLFMLKLFSR